MYYQINNDKYIVTRAYNIELPSLNSWGRTEIMISVLRGAEDRIEYPLLSAINSIKRVDDNNITRWVIEFVNPTEALLYLNEAGLVKVKRIGKFPVGANVIVINDDNIIMDDE